MPDRHEKLSQALDLILSLAATRTGRTMADMMAEMGCGRRTVERLLAAIRQVCVDIEEVPTDEREKRWRMRPNALLGVVRMTSEEIAEIEAAARRLADEGLTERAATLRSAANKLRASMDEAAKRRAEPDVEALLASEGLAARPGPRVVVPEGVIETLRHALLAMRQIRLRYRSPAGQVRVHVLEPCGLLYGARPYLLAVKPGKPDAAVWRLDRVLSAEVAEESFTPRPGFDLATLTRDCFGVWREPPMDVVLRFAEGAAHDAEAWHFHASQTRERQADGTLLIRFHAGGIEEIATHLTQWGDAVEVLAPVALRQRLAGIGEALMRRNAPHTGDKKTSSVRS